jgi:hypothetical protein
MNAERWRLSLVGGCGVESVLRDGLICERTLLGVGSHAGTGPPCAYRQGRFEDHNQLRSEEIHDR